MRTTTLYRRGASTTVVGDADVTTFDRADLIDPAGLPGAEPLADSIRQRLSVGLPVRGGVFRRPRPADLATVKRATRSGS